jgi:hypothetical protein
MQEHQSDASSIKKPKMCADAISLGFAEMKRGNYNGAIDLLTAALELPGTGNPGSAGMHSLPQRFECERFGYESPPALLKPVAATASSSLVLCWSSRNLCAATPRSHCRPSAFVCR